MSGYARLRSQLAAAARRDPVTPSPPVATPPARPGGDPEWITQMREEFAWADAVLTAIAAGATAEALAALTPLLDAPLRPSPFETALEDVGARLATDVGDVALLHAFLERRDAYLRRFANGAALRGLGVLLETPGALDALAWMDTDAAEVGSEAATVDAANLVSPPPVVFEPMVFEPVAFEPVAFAPAVFEPAAFAPASGFVAFAAALDPDTRAYVVTLRHLQDARTATFAVHRVTWHALESEDVAIADLILAFEPDAAAMLRSLDPETLRLRLFFGDGPAYDEFATTDATLFDVEINPHEARIYLKLRRPAAWDATGLAPSDMWRHLRSCVVITEPG